MDVTITLTTAEAVYVAEQTPEGDLAAGLHVILAPLVRVASERRLQTLADQYRELTPDLQAEAVQVLRVWLASKQPVPAPTRIEGR